MKFKSSTAINQRIERSTTKHLVVGIDIAKENHVAGAVNFRGIQRVEPFRSVTMNMVMRSCYVGYKTYKRLMD